MFDAVRTWDEEETTVTSYTGVMPDETDIVAAENYATKWLNIVKQQKLDDETAKWVSKETVA